LQIIEECAVIFWPDSPPYGVVLMPTTQEASPISTDGRVCRSKFSSSTGGKTFYSIFDTHRRFYSLFKAMKGEFVLISIIFFFSIALFYKKLAIGELRNITNVVLFNFLSMFFLHIQHFVEKVAVEKIYFFHVFGSSTGI
jgi:hypothetical protein